MTRSALLMAAALVAGSAAAQDAPGRGPLPAPPGNFQPGEPSGQATDTWIFTGSLPETHETYSGTLVATKDRSDFELKLSGGATCDGGQLKGEVGLVRLPEITCSDDRKLRALFVPQGGRSLKVFGHVGEQRFAAEAHLLGTETPPEPKQTMEPKGPLGLPPPGTQPPADAPKAPAPK